MERFPGEVVDVRHWTGNDVIFAEDIHAVLELSEDTSPHGVDEILDAAQGYDNDDFTVSIAGPGLSVHVTMEQSPLLNEEEQLAAADLSDAVRAVPGVLSVMPGLSAAAGPATLEVTVENTTALRRAVHAAHGHEALQALRLQVTVPRDTVSDPTDYFTMDPATPDADTELFTSLLAHPQTESLSVRISAQAVDVQFRVHSRPADSAQALKSVVPEGAEVRVTSVESMLSFIASDRLRVDQVETVVDTAAADECVEAWNADD